MESEVKRAYLADQTWLEALRLGAGILIGVGADREWRFRLASAVETGRAIDVDSSGGRSGVNRGVGAGSDSRQ